MALRPRDRGGALACFAARAGAGEPLHPLSERALAGTQPRNAPAAGHADGPGGVGGGCELRRHPWAFFTGQSTALTPSPSPDSCLAGEGSFDVRPDRVACRQRWRWSESAPAHGWAAWLE